MVMAVGVSSQAILFFTTPLEQRRHHIHQTVLQRNVSHVALASGIAKRVRCHTFRLSFATYLLEDGADIRTTMIDTYVVHPGPLGFCSPLEHWKSRVSKCVLGRPSKHVGATAVAPLFSDFERERADFVPVPIRVVGLRRGWGDRSGEY